MLPVYRLPSLRFHLSPSLLFGTDLVKLFTQTIRPSCLAGHLSPPVSVLAARKSGFQDPDPDQQGVHEAESRLDSCTAVSQREVSLLQVTPRQACILTPFEALLGPQAVHGGGRVAFLLSGCVAKLAQPDLEKRSPVMTEVFTVPPPVSSGPPGADHVFPVSLLGTAQSLASLLALLVGVFFCHP